MQQAISQEHFNDSNGNPAGGSTTSTGLTIAWQNGPSLSTASAKSQTAALSKP